MITLRPHSKFYQTDFSINKRRIRVSTKTTIKKDALEYAINLHRKKYKEVYLGYKEFILTDVIDYFLKSRQTESYSRSCRYLHNRTVKYLLEFFKNREFNLTNFYNWLDFIESKSKKKKLSGGQLRKYTYCVNTMITYAVKKNVVSFNPLQNIDKSYLPKQKSVERFLSKEEFFRLSNVLDNYKDVKDYILFAINTGLRQGEQLKLEWDRVDFDSKEIYLTETKTDMNRTVLLVKDSYDILKKRQYLDKPFNIKVSNLNYRWKKILKEAKIIKFRWHDLRHTFASWAVKGWHDWQDKPIDLYRLSRWLGHTNIKQTQRYAHLQVEDLRQDIAYY
ncbi:MAG: site-specific integrase [Alphaproteobacteria bacterium]|nr:site-specific integrase [Alphaproteobacteria bacterium]